MRDHPRSELEDEVLIGATRSSSSPGLCSRTKKDCEYTYRLGGVSDVLIGSAGLGFCTAAFIFGEFYNRGWGMIAALATGYMVAIYFLCQVCIKYHLWAAPGSLTIERTILVWKKKKGYAVKPNELQVIRKGKVGGETQTYGLKLACDGGGSIPGRFTLSKAKLMQADLSAALSDDLTGRR